jgi:DNA-binding XRE family transcriptional regulator
MAKELKKPSGISAEEWNLPYAPVRSDHKADLARDLQNPAFRAEWEALQDEFAALDVLLEARRRAGLTQEQVAARMGVSQPALARVEASLGSRKHSPSLATLRKYAAAVGCKLELRLEPQS